MTVVQAFFPKSSMVYDSPQYCKHERVKKKKRYSSAFTSLEVGSGIVILVIMFYVQWHGGMAGLVYSTVLYVCLFFSCESDNVDLGLQEARVKFF